MIELFTADTPNGKKISIMLEEIQYEYKVTKINLFKNEQFNPEFKKISPFSKIPVIKDHDNGKTIFESGAILIYLGNKSGKFYDDGGGGSQPRNWPTLIIIRSIRVLLSNTHLLTRKYIFLAHVLSQTYLPLHHSP